MSIRIALAQKVKLNSIPAAERLYVDLLPETWSEMLPGLPREVIDELAKRALEAERQLRLQRISAKTEKPAAIRVKVATEPTFTRYVFAMPELANVVPENADGKLTLEFDQPIKWDLSDARVALPPALKSIDADLDEDSVAVIFTFNGDPQVRTFREDRSIVVDVSADRAKPKAVEQGAKPKQAAAAPAAVPASRRPRPFRSRMPKPRRRRRPMTCRHRTSRPPQLQPRRPRLLRRLRLRRHPKTQRCRPPHRYWRHRPPRRRSWPRSPFRRRLQTLQWPNTIGRRPIRTGPSSSSCDSPATPYAPNSRSRWRRRPPCSSAPIRSGWCSTAPPRSILPL